MSVEKGFQLEVLWDELKSIVGTCHQPTLLRKASSAVEVLANTGDFDPLLGVVDICVDGCLVTLPREVGTILAVNIGGEPSFPRSQHHEFHLNGPGSCGCSCDYAWVDQGLQPTLRRLIQPSKLIAFVANQDDAGSQLWAYGYDAANNVIRSQTVTGQWVDGWQIPTVFGYAMPDANAPEFARVTRLRRTPGVGSIRVATYDNSGVTGTLLANLQWDETDGAYRQIKLEYSGASWVRIQFRRRLVRFTDPKDWVPLPSSVALVFMLRALKAYDEDDLMRGAGFEATARRYLSEAARMANTPAQTPIQVRDVLGVYDRADSID